MLSAPGHTEVHSLLSFKPGMSELIVALSSKTPLLRYHCVTHSWKKTESHAPHWVQINPAIKSDAADNIAEITSWKHLRLYG